MEKQAIDQITSVHKDLGNPQAEAMLRRWFVEDRGAADAYLWDDNHVVVEWIENQLKVSLNFSLVYYLLF